MAYRRKNGISSYEVHRDLGITQKSAWFMDPGRGGKVRTEVVDSRKKKALQAEVRQHVGAGSALYTDALKSYEGLDEFQHEVVDHAVEFNQGQHHDDLAISLTFAAWQSTRGINHIIHDLGRTSSIDPLTFIS